MTNARTIIITLIATIIGVTPPTGIDQQDVEPALAPLTVVGASAEEQKTLDDALSLFEQAGLELPPLIIEFADTADSCDGYHALFRTETEDTPAAITICHWLRLYLLHELAHAWDHHTLTDGTRQRFLEHWGLEDWADPNDEWGDRGIEMAAHSIAWSLTLTTPTTNPTMLQYVCGYQLLTGNPLPNPELRLDQCDDGSPGS